MQDKLTFVIFKDHLSSRTLHVSPVWLKRVGLTLLVVTLLTLSLAALSLKSYRRSLRIQDGSDALRVDELEKEMAELRASYDALKTQSGSPSAPIAGSVTQVSGGYFSALANQNLAPLPARETLPFRLETMKAQWRGSSLTITTALEYVRDDGGNQQGHFVILARGPGALLSYPENVFQAAGNDVLIRPESGEYFSVGRYREIKATFGPVAHRSDLQAIEVLIFDAQKKLIFVERSGLETMKAGESVKKTEPKPESSTEPKADAPSAAPSATPSEGDL